jgi:hypothetical protein
MVRIALAASESAAGKGTRRDASSIVAGPWSSAITSSLPYAEHAAGVFQGHTKITKNAKLTKGAPWRASQSPNAAGDLLRAKRAFVVFASFAIFV